MALAAHRALGCRDASRVDIRLDRRGNPHVMEINPIPGMHPTHSDLPMIATDAGMSYAELLKRIVDSAATRIPRAGRTRRKAARP
jgi:D-alanine-D-alanine ligase